MTNLDTNPSIETADDPSRLDDDQLSDIGKQIAEVFEKRQADAATDDDPSTSEPAAEPAAEPASKTDPAGDPAGTDSTGGDTSGVQSPEPGDANPDGAPAGVGDAPRTLTIDINGIAYEVDEDTARRWGGLAAWAQQLPPETLEQFGAIEQGQARAVPRADYEQFEAWRRNQQAQQGGRWDDLPDEDRAYIAELERQNAQLGQSVRQAPAYADNQARMQAAASAFDQTLATYATERNLTPDEASAVFDAAIRSGVIEPLANQRRTYAPTGELIVDCDYAEVARAAFDYALIQNPELHARTISAQGAPATALTTATGDPIPGLPPTEAPDPTIAKKAAAGSLAAAPSAAPNNPPFNPAQASPQELHAAMTEEIRQAMSGPTA